MVRHRPVFPLVVGLAASLLVHGAVLVPQLIAVMSAEARPHLQLQARFDPEDFRDQSPSPEQAVRLGIDAPTPSSLTWIGYEQYREHLAALSDTEQAAFRTNPAGEAQPTPAQASSPSDADAELAQTSTPPPAMVEPIAILGTWLDDLLKLGPTPKDAPPTDPSETTRTGRTALVDIIAAVEQWLSDLPESPDRKPAPPLAEAPTRPATNAGTPDRGQPADKESDPTSIIDVPRENWQTGQPIAAQGLEIKPRKPIFTTYLLLTAAPANPTAEILFRRDGKPILARIVQSSGDSRVDEVILNSLYRWRAAGKQLDALSGDETVTVGIRILLTRPSPS